MLINALEARYAREVGFSMFAQDTFSVHKMQPVSSRELYQTRYGSRLFSSQPTALNSTPPAATNPDILIPLIYRMQFPHQPSQQFARPFSQLKALDLVIFDAAGEDLQNTVTRQQFTRYVAAASGIIFLIDPFALPGIADLLPPRLRGCLPQQQGDAREVIYGTINLFEQRNGHRADQKIPSRWLWPSQRPTCFRRSLIPNHLFSGTAAMWVALMRATAKTVLKKSNATCVPGVVQTFLISCGRDLSIVSSLQARRLGRSPARIRAWERFRRGASPIPCFGCSGSVVTFLVVRSDSGDVAMKQLLYTSCEAGKSLDGAGGFQVRAASAGIGPERMRAAVRYMAYGLPDCIHPSQMAPSSSPVRLAFLKTPELGPILCHSVSAGLDPTTRRPGNFFSHVLLDVPPAFTVAAAINTWESDSWRRADGPFEATLQDIEGIRATGSLTDEALGQFASSEHGRKMFSFVLAALLTREPDCRIFLAASSQDVAFCVLWTHAGLAPSVPGGVDVLNL